MTVFAELLQRLEMAKEGGRELDAQIEVAVRWVEAQRAGLKPEHRAEWRSGSLGQVFDGNTGYSASHVTTSVDAALALVKRAGKQIGLYITRVEFDDEPVYDPYYATLCHKGGTTEASGPTWALALVIALLRALTAQEQSHG